MRAGSRARSQTSENSQALRLDVRKGLAETCRIVVPLAQWQARAYESKVEDLRSWYDKARARLLSDSGAVDDLTTRVSTITGDIEARGRRAAFARRLGTA